jgi:cytoskeletal protein RodZ
VQSHTEVGAALRRARIALALPLDSISRELQIPVAQLRAIESGTASAFQDLAQRTEISRRALKRFQLPESWSDLQPDPTGWARIPAGPVEAAARGIDAARPSKGPRADIPALLSPKPISPRQRYIALGVAGVVVATAIGAALMPAAAPVDENELEDLRSSGPSAAAKPAKRGSTTPNDSGRDADASIASSDAGAQAASTQSMPVSPAPGTAPPSMTSAPPSVAPQAASRPYAVLPGSQIVTPSEPALELKARAAVAVDLVLEQGSTQIAMRAGDRIVLMSGRAERVEVSDRHAVELEMTGRAIRLEPVAATDVNPNRGIWTIAGRSKDRTD